MYFDQTKDAPEESFLGGGENHQEWKPKGCLAPPKLDAILC
jgi:hypothetical protein